jgi:hypothetical protein
MHPAGGVIPGTEKDAPLSVKHVLGNANVTLGKNGEVAVGPVVPTDGLPFDAPKSRR